MQQQFRSTNNNAWVQVLNQKEGMNRRDSLKLMLGATGSSILSSLQTGVNPQLNTTRCR
jgi:hypothetical protein